MLQNKDIIFSVPKKIMIELSLQWNRNTISFKSDRKFNVLVLQHKILLFKKYLKHNA